MSDINDQLTNFFHYDPLPDNRTSFRLLELLPGTYDELLRFRLRTQPLHHAPPPYEAISYVWRVFNDDRDHATIQYDDGPQQLAITRNLQSALKSIRKPDSIRLLWTDAICINQNDHNERNDQVRCMRTVYKNASQVLAWLGNLNFDSTSIFGFLERVSAVCPAPREYGSAKYDFTNLDHLLASASYEYWEMLGKLHKATLFSRIWVVQELNLAFDGYLLTSESKIRWAHFRTAVFWINKRRPVKVDDFQIPWSALDPYLYLQFVSNDHARPSITNSDKRQPVHYVLRSVRNCASTIPHDKVYAILGHCSLDTWLKNTEGHRQIPIDYEIPYTEVYIAVARRLLEEPQPMLTLSLVDHEQNAWTGSDELQAQMPSWVPNWKIPARAYFLPNEFRTRYKASTEELPSFEIQDRQLEVQGCVVDKVTWRSPTMSSDNLRAGLQLGGGQNQSLANVLYHIWNRLKAGKRFPITEERLLESFCLTLNAGNRILSKQTYKTEVKTDQRISDFVAVLEKLSIDVKGVDENVRDIRGDIPRFLATTEELCRGRCFFVTDSGLMGLGPRIMSTGDELCVLFGSQVPFVLRPLPLKQQYRLCGESYVHGIMDGEAIDELKMGTLKNTLFKII